MSVESRVRRSCTAVVLTVVAVLAGAQGAGAQVAPGEGAGGTILVITHPGDPFGRYYAEILRAEGLMGFAVEDIGGVRPETLAGYDAVVLASGDLSAGQAGMLGDWVRAGGNLVAMRPGAPLRELLGLGADAGDVDRGYVGVDTRTPPGAGISGVTLQIHGAADLWSGATARTVARLYADAATPTASPAVTLRSVGTAGGQAAAFTYDLARSVVATRQGNVAWAGQKRETHSATAPIRPHDLFFPDWVDFDRIRVPQADEQQRLLANLLTEMTRDRTPLPRLWYLPRGEKAAVVLTGDDHGNAGTAGQFDAFAAASPPGCSVADWECVRSTSYLYPGTPLADARLAAYQAEGFEVGLHLVTFCRDYTPASLQQQWATGLAAFAADWPSLRLPRTSRSHCVAWSDWAGEPLAELAHGVRFDTNYYYFPSTWVQDRPGLFTGSGMPMRFADADGSLIDVYQAATQLTDETLLDGPGELRGTAVRRHIRALLDAALGPEGFYGVFTANMHTDDAVHQGANAIVEEALARGVPVVSSAQMLDWLDGRGRTSFSGLGSDGHGGAVFTLRPGAGARGLQLMLPARSAAGRLTALTRDGTSVTTTSRTSKGVEYVVAEGLAGAYAATYGSPAPPPGATGEPAHTRPPAVLQGSPRPRTSRRGRVKLQVACRSRTRACRVTLRLEHRRRTVAHRRAVVPAGTTRTVALRLSPQARRKLATRGRLKVRAILVNRTGTARIRSATRLTLRAPR
jgi:hypothetical protein